MGIADEVMGLRNARRAPVGLHVHPWQLAALPAVLLAFVLATTPSTLAAVSDGGVAGPPPSPAPGEFSLNLADDDDFVGQYTQYWCIGASMQMMLNIVGATDDESRAAQERYMRVARAEGPSLEEVDHGEPTDQLTGAGASGWARGLTLLGAGRYEERALDEFDRAVRRAALALRKTNRPVGLIVWRGAHAWVMTGFTATADPAFQSDFRVTGIYVQDPWYPRISSIWGRGQEPNTFLSTEKLSTAFLPRRGGQWHAEQAGKFVVVLPVATIRAAGYGRRHV